MIASKGELQGLLNDMEGLFRDLSPWLAGQYDAASGGFYYARSYIRNPIHLLSYTKPLMTKEELLLIVQTTLYNMSMLLRSDGGFSRELAHSPSAPNVAQVKDEEFYPDMPKPVHLSEGKVEGDMNAASQALLIRSLCYQIIGAEAPSLGATHFKSFYDEINKGIDEEQ